MLIFSVVIFVFSTLTLWLSKIYSELFPNYVPPSPFASKSGGSWPPSSYASAAPGHGHRSWERPSYLTIWRYGLGSLRTSKLTWSLSAWLERPTQLLSTNTLPPNPPSLSMLGKQATDHHTFIVQNMHLEKCSRRNGFRLVIGQDRRFSAKKQNITSARSAILH